MPNVNRNTNENSGWQSWDNAQTPSGASPPRANSVERTESAPAQNAAAPFKKPEGDTAVFGDDSRLESGTRALIGRLGHGDSLELKLGGEVKTGEQFGLSATAKIAREDDGSVTVELEGEGKVGGGGAMASAKVGVAAGTKLHFETAAEAADFLDAFTKAGVLVAAGQDIALTARTAHRAGARGDVVDAQSRLLGHLKKTTELKTDVLAEATIEKAKKLYGFEALEAKAAVKAKDGFKVDLKKGTFTRTTAISVDASTDLKLKWLNMGGGGKGTITASTTYKLTDAELSALKGGKLSPTILLGEVTTRPPVEQKLKAELEVSQRADAAHLMGEDLKTKFSVEKVIDEKTFSGGIEKALSDLGDLKWKAEIDVGMGGATNSIDVKTDVFSLEASAKYRHKEELSGECGLTEWIPRINDRLNDQKNLDALRATASR